MSGLDSVKLHLVNTLDEVVKLHSWLGERRPVHALGLDTETGGFSRRNDALRLVQVGDGEHGWAIPWERWGGIFEDIVKRWDGRWILHNAPFDHAFLKREGVVIPWTRIDDTMTMARINEPNYSMALKTQAARHVDSAAGGLQNELAGTSWTWANVPIDYKPYWLYGALDPVLTYKLFEYHHPITQREAPDAYELEMAVLAVTSRMEEYGAHVDRPLAAETYTKFMEYCKTVEAWTVENYKVKPGSNAAVVAILEEAGFTFEKATASGAKALDAEVLGHIDHPLAQAVLQRRQLQKMATTYLRHYVDDADENDLMHPSINTLGARTSRMSMSEPNLQNLPRHGTSRAGDVVRSCFNTRYEGGSLLMCDFSQVEMRLLANFAGDIAMIDAFKSGGDFFVNLARQIFQDDTITKKDPRRQITKNAGYAKIYGAGVRKFAITANISEAQAQDFLTRFDQLYPGVRRFQDDIIRNATQRLAETGEAFARSPLTGRRFVADKGKEYSLTNFVVQGSAAEVLKMKLVELDACGLGEYMVVPVHDEIICDVPADQIDDVAHTLRKVMNDDKLLQVPLEAMVSRGPSWGQKTDYEFID
jgi:DNA polymerase-1